MKKKNKLDKPHQASNRIKVQSRRVLSEYWARLEHVVFNYQRSDGQWQSQQREIYHRGHGAAILLYDLSRETIILTRQFRYPAWTIDGDGFLLEVPAGIVESDDPAATIRAETVQETGFVIDEPVFLFTAFVSPGSVTEQLHYFAAPYDVNNRKDNGGGLEEEGEDIEVLEVTLQEAEQWIQEGKIVDAKTIILVQYARLAIFN